MLGKIFSVLVISSVVFGGITGNIDLVSKSIVEAASDAVNLSFSLLGTICLWNGVFNVLNSAGVTNIIAKIIKPLLDFMYPDARKCGVNTNSIAVNYSANFLGLGNAALPLGINAMQDLSKEKSAPKDTANNDMIMFSVLNTAPIQLIPTTLLALRSAYGSENPYSILLPIWICSVVTTIFGITVCKILSRFNFGGMK